MAGSDIGKKVLNFLDGLFKTLASPVPGFDVDDVKVKQDGDNFSSLFQFTNVSEEGNVQTFKDERTGKAIKDIEGNDISLAILLKTTNAQSVLDPLFSGMNELGEDDFVAKNDLLDVLLGAGRTDNTIKGATADSLLGINIAKNSGSLYSGQSTYMNTQWSWADISNSLQFALECQAPGKDYGAVSGRKLSDCGKLVGEYCAKVGLTKATNEVQVNWEVLGIPILTTMQESLKDYFNKAIAAYAPKGVENNATPEDPTAPTQEELDQQAQQEQQEQAARMERMQNMGFQFSKHIDVTLRKITATSELEMTAIKANYSPSLVLADMEEILDQPEFLEALPEELTSYAIDVDDDGFDIEPCEECIECGPCESLCEVFKAGIRAYRNLYIIHWMSKGNDMMKLHIMSEEMYGELVQEIDTIGELLVEKQGTVPQLDFPCDYIPVQDYDFQTGLDYIKNLIQMYIDCIDFAYCNQDSDVQSVFDEWLRYWKKQLRYFVERQEA